MLPQPSTSAYAPLPLIAARPPPEPRTPQIVALERAEMTAAPPTRLRVRPCG
ncbi:hypothetical protein ACOT81_39770 [Streptomyces sp. WI04-05B]|uniref:Uncharacterized protein n=1 Tax=Streptomyces turgidiscabies (strain Car8) TaxID=698760 RepID=L7F687_STRT8|nr:MULTISPECIES: hypothetical protein [unclassified Streptomyces]ELP66155.1 hypothetical protein STRTUCAR8_10259 [Streptomyces turgidiscabies Car8]MDX2548552.1 hypothetical protein [Streptomyces sp. WI04-05B]MDX2582588.1 hypothetical protein [Streptomyces sp. WI04-05A]